MSTTMTIVGVDHVEGAVVVFAALPEAGDDLLLVAVDLRMAEDLESALADGPVEAEIEPSQVIGRRPRA